MRARTPTLLSRLLSMSTFIDDGQPEILTVSQLKSMIHTVLLPRPP
jgi:hypothetical protein